MTIGHSEAQTLQIAYGWSTNLMAIRRKKHSVWQSWNPLGGSSMELSSCDLDTVLGVTSFYLIISSQTYENTPEGLKVGFLDVQSVGLWTHQFFYELAGSRVWKRSFIRAEKRMNWTLISGNNGNTYNITQEISQDTFQNTYNITTSPNITTDNNGWIQAIDDETTNEINATDMTGAIMSMLNSTGYCHLSAGTFYVSGGIDMPYGSVLEGCGKNTIIRLLSSVTSGYIVRVIQNNTIRGICFSGSKTVPENLYIDGTNFGKRHGIYLVANADGQ